MSSQQLVAPRAPTRLLYLALVVLVICCAFFAHAQTTWCTSTNTNNLQLLPGADFKNVVATGSNYRTSEGVTHDASGFVIQAPSGSSASINFGSKVNIASGFRISFEYKMEAATANQFTNGFAFVIQNRGAEAREGSNHWLGYHNPNTLAFEFDYYTDSAANDVSGTTPHAAWMWTRDGASTSSIHPMTCNTGTTATTDPIENTNCMRLPSGLAGAVTITVLPVLLNNERRASIEMSTTVGGVTRVLRSATTSNDIFQHAPVFANSMATKNIVDDAGLSWIGFTSSATDGKTTSPVTITNVKVSTAGVKSVRLNTTPSTRFVSAAADAANAYDTDVVVEDLCSITYKALSAEINGLTAPTLTGTSANVCKNLALTPAVSTRASGQVAYRVRLGCEKSTATNIGKFQVTSYAGGNLEVDLQARFSATDAVARRSTITRIAQGATVLCGGSGTACGTAQTPFSLSNIVAGTELTITLATKDEFGNDATGAGLNVRVQPTENGSGSGQTSVTGTNTSAPVVKYIPTKAVVDANLEVTINGQLLTSYTTVTVVAAAPAGAQSSVTAGTGQAQYTAGQLYTFELTVKDRFQNVATAATTTSTVTFYLKATDGGALCTATQTADNAPTPSKYTQSCPLALKTGATDVVQITTGIRYVGQYQLVCTLNDGVSTTPCYGMENYQITVVPAAEDVTKAYLKRRSLPVFQYPTAASPTTANFQTQITAGLDATLAASHYATIGASSVIDIQSVDRFGNERTARNVGADYQVIVTYGVAGTPTTEDEDVIPCTTGLAPTTGKQILTNSRCEYSTQNAYSVSLVPRNSTYHDNVAVANAYKITVRQGNASTTRSWFILSQLATPDTASSTVTMSPTSVTAGDIVTYSAQLRDSPATGKFNEIRPLWLAASPAEPNVDYLNLVHALQSSSGTLIPQALDADGVTPLAQGTKPVWKWDAASSSWTTKFKIRGATQHVATAIYKQTTAGSLTFTPVAAAPNYVTSRLEATSGTETSKMEATVTWSLFDEFGNKAQYASGFPALTATPAADCDPSTQAGATPHICAGSTTSNTCVMKQSFTLTSNTYTCNYKLGALRQGSATGSTNSIDVGVPKDTAVSFSAVWRVGTATSADASAESSWTTASNGALQFTAGQYLWMRFITLATTTPAEEFDPQQMVVTFLTDAAADGTGGTLAMPGQQITLATPSGVSGGRRIIYVAYQITQALASAKSYTVKAQYGLTAAVWTSTPTPATLTGPTFVTTKVKPTTFAAAKSPLSTASNTMTACDNAATADATNTIYISPYDQYDNPLSLDTAAGSPWLVSPTTMIYWFSQVNPARMQKFSDAADIVIADVTFDAANNRYAWKVCRKTSAYWTFAFDTNPNKPLDIVNPTNVFSYSTLTFVQPAAPTTIRYLEGTATVTEKACTLGTNCNLKFQVLDQFSNVLSSTDIAAKGAADAWEVTLGAPNAAAVTAQQTAFAALMAASSPVPAWASVSGGFTSKTTVADSNVLVGDTVTEVNIPADTLATLADHTLTVKFSLKTGGPITAPVTLKVAQQGEPKYYIATIGTNKHISHTFAATGTAPNQAIEATGRCADSTTCTQIAGSYVAAAAPQTLLLNFYDANFNPWTPTGTDVSGMFSTASTSISLSQDARVSGLTWQAQPIFRTSGRYTAVRMNVKNTALPGFAILIVPGAINSWVFVHPHFGQTRYAGNTFQVRATPYDVLNNVVSATSSEAAAIKVITDAAKLLTLRVFEGTYNCAANSLEATTSTSGSLSTDVTTPAAFKLDNVTYQGTEAILDFKTERSGSLAVSGSYLQYTYFMKTASVTSNKVLSCNHATINYIPHAIHKVGTTYPNNQYSGEIEGTAIENGDKVSFTYRLADKFNNTIGFVDPASTGAKPFYEVYKCTNNVPSTTPCTGQDCVIAASTNKQATNFQLVSSAMIDGSQTAEGSKISFALKYVRDLNPDADGLGTDPGETTYTFPCKELAIYHSTPSKVVRELPATVSTTIKAGVPFEIKFNAFDQFDLPVNYANVAFNKNINGTTVLDWESYAVNNYTIRVSGEAKDTDGLVYTFVNETAITSPPTRAFTTYVTPAWAANYEVSVALVNRITGELYKEITDGTFRLVATPPVCTGNEVVALGTEVNKSTCAAKTAASVATFLCTTAAGAGQTVNYEQAADCRCGAGLTKVGPFCTSTPAAFDADELTLAAPRVCPQGYTLCGDLQTCVEKPALCPVRVTCAADDVQCFDGTCVPHAGACGTPFSCASDDQVLCPNNQCIDSGAGNFCQQVRECNFPNTYRCTDGSCVGHVQQCPTNSACPAGSYKCADNSCVLDVADCPAPAAPAANSTVINSGVGCAATKPFLCPSGACAVDQSFCPTQPSCGLGENSVLCPDRATCVSDVAQCTVKQQCPTEKPVMCAASGQCVASEVECPSGAVCPTATPVRCAANGACVASKEECDAVISAACPAASPVRCGSGKCVKSASACETMTICSFYKPVLCSTGECVAAIELCPTIPTNSTTGVTALDCAADRVKCPGTGFCVSHLAFCPTVRSCPEGFVRCANGECYRERFVGTRTFINEDGQEVTQTGQDVCPTAPSRTQSCAEGMIQCPITTTGIMCRKTIQDCPGDAVCPANKPVRCGDARCVSDVSECRLTSDAKEAEVLALRQKVSSEAYEDEAPTSRVACGQSTWAAEAKLCGTPATCPSSAPIKCLDGSCAKYLTDCSEKARPSEVVCSTDRPFLCSDGSCAINSYSCSMARCSEATKPIRCPFVSSGMRCVATVEECQDIYDQDRINDFTSKCTFGYRCWDGACVVESRLCPARVCPSDAPYLCPTGSCSKSKYTCPKTNGCPFDLPHFCEHTAGCVADKKTCDTMGSRNAGIICGTYTTTNATSGATIVLPLHKCGDGTCRQNKDECYLTGPFGCPPETPVRCANGQCVATPVTGGSAASADSDYKCKTNSADFNACPAHLPVRCPGGLCAQSLTRCPTFSMDNSNTASAVCRASKFPKKVDLLRDKVDSWDKAEMKTRCDDGSCAFALGECPLITPCGPKQFRCGDGSCRDLPLDPTNPTQRATMAPLSFMGASCPVLPTATGNKCPVQLPYLCQSGECAANRSQCMSNYPLDLEGQCCGKTHSFKAESGVMNPQGEDVGICEAVPANTECVATVKRDGSATKGCPAGMTRCADTGFCLPTDAPADLCQAYTNIFNALNGVVAAGEEIPSCPIRCPFSNRCVQDAAECTETTGCPAGHALCENGDCVAPGTTCPVGPDCADAAMVKCPDTKRCVADINECTTPMGCPFSTPVLCADGQCKARVSTLSGVTNSFWPNVTLPVGIADDVCKPSLQCTNPLFPVLCGNGECVPSSDYCAPIVSRCQFPEGGNNGNATESCRAACPFALNCVSVPFIEGTTTCDYSQLAATCDNFSAGVNTTMSLTACPSQRPTLCPSGLCAESPAQCSSPYYDEARTFECKADQFRCYNGACVDKPFDCIKMTAAANAMPELTQQNTVISGSNVCKDPQLPYVCPDGLCVKNAGSCAPLKGCPAGSLLCESGACAASTIDAATGKSVAPVCTDHPTNPGEAYVQSCAPGGVPCADGTCRPNGQCPMTAGCSINRPFSCTWRADTRCVRSINECRGWEQEEKSETFELQSAAATTILYTAEQLDQLRNRFPQLDVERLAAHQRAKASGANNKFGTKDVTTQAFGMLQTQHLPYSPAENQVDSCWEGCERDNMAIQSTTLITARQGVTGLTVSQNQNFVPRTTLDIPAQAVSKLVEFNVYPTPPAVFGGASFAEKNFYTPYTFKGPRAVNQNKLASEYSTKVISTPFACAALQNNTRQRLAQPIIVQSYVDLTAYTAGGSAAGEAAGAEALTAVPCPFIGSYDSALAMGTSNCGGNISVTETGITVDYDAVDCQWQKLNTTTNQLETYPKDVAATFSATFTKAIETNNVATTKPWTTTQEAEQLMCFKITTAGGRTFADGTSIVGAEFCAQFSRVTDLITIAFPENLLLTPGTNVNLLQRSDLEASTTWDNDQALAAKLGADSTTNVRLYGTVGLVCDATTGANKEIAKEDICLGAYTTADMTWKCIRQSYEARVASPAWAEGSPQRQVKSTIEDSCDQNAYAFLHVELPPPGKIKESFCFWCTYGWIILVVVICFAVVLLIVIILALKFSNDRRKYKEKQAILNEKKEHAQDLIENQGGIGVADADGELQMVVNPLVIQLQDLNKQLTETNEALGTQARDEEHNINRLEQERLRLQKEIQRLESEVGKREDGGGMKAKRVEPSGPSGPSGGPAGAGMSLQPARPGQSGPSGPSAPGAGLSGPMRAPPK